MSWLASLASAWDIGGLHNAIEQGEAWDSPNNARLAKVNYLTDSRPYPKDLLVRGFTPYVGIAGLGADSALLPVAHPQAGAFGYDRITSTEDIRDGLATTMLVS